ncbi:MAG: ABC transporter ATP-binding protein [Hyphomicrobiales bacterium]
MTFKNKNALALQARAVSFQTSTDAPLVANANLSLEQGEILAIVGPNGAGKTTLIRMIAGLAKPSLGEIIVAGVSLGDMSFAERARQIAYVGQSDDPDGRLTVSEYVALGFLPHAQLFANGTATDISQNAIAAVGLKEFTNRRLDKLSGGERQKAKIARAICQRPTILVLDEPTNHLDPRARGELLSLVASMGISVVAALHDLTLIDAFAHKVAVLQKGQLKAFGVPQQTLSSKLVHDVFQVDMHRLSHPAKDCLITALDIEISRENSTADAINTPH